MISTVWEQAAAGDNPIIVAGFMTNVVMAESEGISCS